MQGIPELTPEIRRFAKMILAAKADPMYESMIGWFRAGAWYSDALAFLVLVLPDDDPTLAEILDSMRSGTFYENEVIAKNILRWGMAGEEAIGFMANNVRAESLLVHARTLVQNSIRQTRSDAIPASVFRVLSSTILKLTRFLVKKEFRKVGSSLDDLLWWLILGAVGTLIFL